MTRAGVPSFHLNRTGICSAMELAIRFYLWASAMRGDPTVGQIQNEFDVSRATAYRWRNAWLAVRDNSPSR